jgi:methylenetetrahydrofolate reductase (NADPH)
MKIGHAILQRGKSLSFEFFPPKDQSGEEQLFETITKLDVLNPTFVSVTYGAGGSTLKNTRHVVLRIQRETSLVPMPHQTCVDQSRDELKNILEDYKRLGIENVLALRGDPPKGMERFAPPKDGFCYAKDLVALAASLSAFSIGVAVYPEGHIESPNLEMDMYYTKQKIDAGADFAITQMFFDNHFFYNFLERAKKADIHIPIIPGIMPIMNVNKIEQFSQRCGAKLPVHLVQKLDKVRSSDQAAKKVGIEIATEQCADLLKNGVTCFHFYTLNRSEAVIEIINNLGLNSLGEKGSIKIQI